MSFVATAIVGSAIIGAVSSDRASSRQADAVNQSSAESIAQQDRALEEQRRQFDITRGDTSTQRQVGDQALNWLSSNVYDQPGQFDPGSFEASPDYNFRVQEGEQGVQNYMSANKMRLSGAAIKAMERFRQGTASGEYGDWHRRQLTTHQQNQNDRQNYLGRIYQLAGYGPAGVNTAAQAGSQYSANVGQNASNVSNIMQNRGTNMANIYGQQGANMNNAAQAGLQNFISYRQNQDMMNLLSPNVPGDAYMPARRYGG